METEVQQALAVLANASINAAFKAYKKGFITEVDLLKAIEAAIDKYRFTGKYTLITVEEQDTLPF